MGVKTKRIGIGIVSRALCALHWHKGEQIARGFFSVPSEPNKVSNRMTTVYQCKRCGVQYVKEKELSYAEVDTRTN